MGKPIIGIVLIFTLWILSGCMAALPFIGTAIDATNTGTQVIKATKIDLGSDKSNSSPVPPYALYQSDTQTTKKETK